MSDARTVLRVLLDMRPALGGHAGIPQDSRLIFAHLHQVAGIEAQGLLQASLNRLPAAPRRSSRAAEAMDGAAMTIDQASRTVIALTAPRRVPRDGGRALQWRADAAEWWRARVTGWRALAGAGLLRTWALDSRGFEDFFWQALFARTLAPRDRDALADARFRVCADPWRTLHRAGQGGQWGRPSCYPTLDTTGIDVFVAHTPYPARLKPQTALMVRYYDAVPVYLPQTIDDPARHQAWHLAALRANVQAGAWFSCPSESARAQLLRMFPSAEPRTSVLPCMVAAEYVPGEFSSEQVPEIVRSHLSRTVHRLQPEFATAREQEDFYAEHLGVRPWPYVLIVSTLEPRKNHACVLAAWDRLRAQSPKPPRLVFVGGAGWRQEALHPRLRALSARGELFMLDAVPAWALCVLYQNARLTVCPSVGEGFDLSGLEAMACGGVVAASDIAVHREIYGEAAAYFDPYDPAELAALVRRMGLGDEAVARREALRADGLRHAQHYRPAAVLPRWQDALRHVHVRHREQFA